MKRKKKAKAKSPLIRLVGLDAAAAAASIAEGRRPVAAPGDLDPSFGDVGRQSSVHSSNFPQWSIDVQADDALLLGGGGEYCYWGCYEDYFVDRLLPNGTPDAELFCRGAERNLGPRYGVAARRQGHRRWLYGRCQAAGVPAASGRLARSRLRGRRSRANHRWYERSRGFGDRRPGRPHRRGGHASFKVAP